MSLLKEVKFIDVGSGLGGRRLAKKHV